MKIKPVHPFAARMAPEIAFEALDGLSARSLILDPMAGSGTVLRTISELGYRGVGFDIDPLSVLMSKAWTSKMHPESFLVAAETILENMQQLDPGEVTLPWIDNDLETQEFIRYWFAGGQIADLRKLSFLIHQGQTPYTDLLKVALSRLIIVKTNGASLAADVSHSRPHRVKTTNDFDVTSAFLTSCKKLTRSLESEKLLGQININRGDARDLDRVRDRSIDCVITSPPYLNALDYMRGHKLSLVWLGYRVGELSAIRGNSVGAEKAPDNFSNILRAKQITAPITDLYTLPQRKINMIYRYALDMDGVLRETARVLKRNRNAIFVIGNSNLQGVHIENTAIAEMAAAAHGLRVSSRREREIPPNKRYLPPPADKDGTHFHTRMRTETVLTFNKVSR